MADTNNSLIRYIDLNKEEDAEILTLELKGVKPPMPKAKSLKRLRKRASADTKIVTVDAVTSREGDLNLKISLPDGYHFSKVNLLFLFYLYIFFVSLNLILLVVHRKRGVSLWLMWSLKTQ